MGLERYLPVILRRRLAVRPEPVSEPESAPLEGAVLFTDISGFTRLTERLAAEGPEGVERLTTYINEYFARLIDLVESHGGDIVQFAGDALLALWPADEESDLATVAHLATQCGLEIHEALTDFAPEPEVRLTQTISVGAGRVYAVHLGGVFDRWEFTVAGDAVDQIAEGEARARKGELMVGAPVWELISRSFEAESTEGSVMRVIAIRKIEPLRPLEVPELGPETLDGMRVYIPGTVLAREDAGHSHWLGELRRISVIFVHLPAVSFATEEGLERAQRLVQATQNALYRWEGSTNKIGCDEKGTTMLAALGLPPLSHEDDPMRAVRAAMDIHSRLSSLGMAPSIGVTTGTAYCGVIGSPGRAEYTMMGGVVNLASRLMSAAGGRILCDQATVHAAEAQLGFEQLEPIWLKGRDAPEPVARPTGEVKEVVRAQTEIVGRQDELAVLSDALQALVRTHESGVAVIHGEAGIGKSRLLVEVLQMAETFGVRTLVGGARAIERSTPWFSWRDIVLEVFGLGPSDDLDAVLARTEPFFEAHPDARELAPLLDPVTPDVWPDNETTSELEGEVRANNIAALLTQILDWYSGGEPLLVVLEDGHWIDTASWALIASIARELDRLLLCVTTRPMSAPIPIEYEQLVQRPDCHMVSLDQLSNEDTLKLVSQRLGVASLPESLARVFRERAGGNPFFAEELAYMLRDTGVLILVDGACRLADPNVDLAELGLPDTVQGVVVSRVDRLEPGQQLVLKTASVVGREFPERIVADVLPDPEARAGVGAELEEITTTGLLVPEDPEPDRSYLFKHALGQEAIYELMLFAQRRALHRSVAEWYEESSANDPTPWLPVLAHHWVRADDTDKALEYLVRAGDDAFNNSASREAISFYQQALERVDGGAPAPPKLRSHLASSLARGWFQIGDLDRAERYGRMALKELGFPQPRTLPTLVLSLWKEIARRLLQAYLPTLFANEKREEARRRRMEAVRVQAKLTEIAGFRDDKVGFMYSSMKEVNLAAPVGPSPELGLALGMMANVMGTIPMAKVAASLRTKALAIAEAASQLAGAYIYSRCSVSELYGGQWDEIEDHCGRAIEISARLTDRRVQEESSSIYGWALYFQGRFPEAEEAWARVRRWSNISGNPQTAFWAQICQGLTLARLGRVEEAVAVSEQALPFLESKAADAEKLMGWGSLAYVYFRAGDHERARSLADRTYAKTWRARPMVYFVFQAAQVLPEIYRGLRDASSPTDKEGRAELQQRADRAAKAMTSWGKVFPHSTATGLYEAALILEDKGDTQGAIEGLRAALIDAERSRVLFTQALCHLGLTRLLPPGDPDRQRHAVRTAELMAACGAGPGSELSSAA